MPLSPSSYRGRGRAPSSIRFLLYTCSLVYGHTESNNTRPINSDDPPDHRKPRTRRAPPLESYNPIASRHVLPPNESLRDPI